MRLLWIAWFLLVTFVFLIILLPREDLARWYLHRIEGQTGATLVWPPGKGTFGLMSAHLDEATLIAQGTPMLDHLAVDASFGLTGVDFALSRLGGSVVGTFKNQELTFKGQDFPLPDIPGDWVSNVRVGPDGSLTLPDPNGSGTVEIKADPGKNLAAFGVGGHLQARGDYRVQHGNLEFHAGIAGDKAQGHIDLTATKMASSYMLGGTLEFDFNGQRQTLHISGTPANPVLSAAAAAPGLPPGFAVPASR